MLSFNRFPSWSAATAADRLRRRLRQVLQRQAEIAAELSLLEGEAAELVGFADRLHGLLKVEEATIERRTTSNGGTDRERGRQTQTQTPMALKVELSVSAAVSHVGKRAYSREGKCFMPLAPSPPGSTRPKRYTLLDAEDDPRLLRLIKMIEIPGLLHTMIMAEKAQRRIDVGSVEIPEAALGINLADAYRGHIFSLEAYKALVDPDQAEAFVALLATGFSPADGS